LISKRSSAHPKFFNPNQVQSNPVTRMLPTAGVNRVFGLLDLLKAYNGKADIATLTIDLRIDLDELLPIIDTAEYLGLVAVKEGEISLTELGNKAHSSKIAERKKLVHQRLETLEPFSDIAKLLNEQGQVTRFTLARFISAKYGPTLDIPTLISIIISWGVFTGLFGYDGQSERLLPKTHVH
jgi:hypothetical protein